MIQNKTMLIGFCLLIFGAAILSAGWIVIWIGVAKQSNSSERGFLVHLGGVTKRVNTLAEAHRLSEPEETIMITNCWISGS